MQAADLLDFSLVPVVMASHALPVGALGGNALHGDVRFVVSHGKGPRFWDTSFKAFDRACRDLKA